jgi:hypothetical protein
VPLALRRDGVSRPDPLEFDARFLKKPIAVGWRRQAPYQTVPGILARSPGLGLAAHHDAVRQSGWEWLFSIRATNILKPDRRNAKERIAGVRRASGIEDKVAARRILRSPGRRDRNSKRPRRCVTAPVPSPSYDGRQRKSGWHSPGLRSRPGSTDGNPRVRASGWVLPGQEARDEVTSPTTRRLEQ